jgi:branched-chain amino acid transport system substrate-binding protein
VFFAIFAVSVNGCNQQKEKEAKVNVAFNIPISGDFGIYGQTIRDGALFALEELNNKGLQVKLNFDIQDNMGKPNNTISIMQKQFFKPIDIYVSGIKPQSMSIFDQIKEKGIPHFVWIFDAFICAQNKNTFRTWVSYKYEPEKYIQYIKFKNPSKIAITYVNLPHVDEEMNKILVPKLNEMSISSEKILIEVYDWTVKDFKDIVAKIKNFNPDLIILNGFQGNLVGLIKSLRSYSMINNGNVIVTYDMLDAASLLTKEELEGIRLIAPLFNIDEENIQLLQWKERFKKKFNRMPLYTDAYSYDMVQVIEDSAKRVKIPSTHKDWIESIRNTDIDGVTGKLKFDKDGDLILSLRIGAFRDGKILIDDSDK